MNKMSLMTGIAGLLILTMTSCQKDPLDDLTTEDSRIFITNRDSTVDFTAYSTFSIADSVGVIENDKDSRSELTSFDAAIISALRTGLQQRGFQEVPKGSIPDLGINVSRVYITSTGVSAFPSYWDFYGGFYDPFYWGYGGFGYYDPIYYGPTYYNYYQVTQGTLSIDMLDLKNANTTRTIKPVWSAMARGSGVFASTSAASQVNAFFEQSPYLRTQ
ncbi:MAG: DUF4136 domain-containing protein [Chitinophagaceae bacterium]|nr:DUF4136 domain-containing protein [Chitinophagaceae bacterium]